MKAFCCDWAQLIRSMGEWEGAPRELRRRIAGLRSSGQLPAEEVGAAAVSLVGAEILQPSAGDDAYRLHPEFRACATTLRAFDDCGLALEPTQRSLELFVNSVFTTVEVQQMSTRRYKRRAGFDDDIAGQAAAPSYLRSMLEAEDLATWESVRLPPSWSRKPTPFDQAQFAEGERVEDLRALLRALLDLGGACPLAELAGCGAELPMERLGMAVFAGIRHLALFPALDAGGRCHLILWPDSVRRLQSPHVNAPAPLEALEVWTRAWGLEDLTQLLVRAADPLRLKASDHSLFAKVVAELAAGMAPLPPWVDRHPWRSLRGSGRATRGERDGLERRVHAARARAHRHHFVKEDTAGLHLCLTEAGRSWLALAPGEQARSLIDALRSELGLDELEPELEEEEDEDLGLGGLGIAPSSLEAIHQRRREAARRRHEREVKLHVALRDAFRSLVPGEVVSIEDFVGYHSREANPFLDLAREDAESGLIRHGFVDVEELELGWAVHLREVVEEHLFPLGVARPAQTEAGVGLEWTEVGLYLLGDDPDFDWGRGAVERPVRIQPDFEVMFLAPSPAHEASFQRFAKRIGHGMGALFRIEREAAHAAAHAGMGCDQVLEAMAEASTEPVPENVERELRAWFAGSETLEWRKAFLVHCPDHDVALRMLAAARGKLEALSDTVLILTDERHFREVTNACKKAGLLLEGEGPKKETKRRSTRGRSRRRYW